MKTKVHELLGVEQGKKFTCSTYPDDVVFSISDGTLYRARNGECNEAGSSLLIDMIEHPDIIIRRPAYTPEQVKVMKWLRDGGYSVVSMGKDGQIIAFDCEVYAMSSGWYATSEDYSQVFGKGLQCLRPLIPDWRTPLDIEAALKDAGEGAQG